MNVSRLLIARSVAICFLLACIPLRAEQAAAGMVQRIKGQWIRSNNGKELLRGSLLLPGERIQSGYSTSNAIEVLLFDHGGIWKQTCTIESPCEGSYRPLPVTHQEPHGFWAFLTNYPRSASDARETIGAMRSLTSGGPNHCLLIAEQKDISLTPALERLQPGRYAAEFSQSQSNATSSEPLKRIFEWNRKSDARVAPLQPGFYALRILDGSDTVGSIAAILVVDQKDSERQRIWAEAKRRTGEWTKADPYAINDLLLTTLLALHDGPP